MNNKIIKPELIGLSNLWKKRLKKIKKYNKNGIKVNRYKNFNNDIIDAISIWNLMVFQKQKIIYVKYPKNGGTTVLKKIINKNKLEYINYENFKTKFCKWIEELTDEKLSEYFIFTIVRNPYDRMLSSYQYIHPNETEYLNYCQNILDNGLNYHCIDQSSICNNKNIFDYIGKLEENYLESVNLFCSKFNIVPFKSLPVKNKSISNDENENNNKTIKIINEIFKDDFKLFDYPMLNI